ncbi:hypothetical protein N752_25020 [Desulforamulus aquiferis]|nr:hypothetical protein [Desulforamulus aquiferis]RYD02594.1 hypothetical protein N752_25020 [Desulforamulus aquiferis]
MPGKMLQLLKENGHKIDSEKCSQTKNMLERMTATKDFEESLEYFILRDMKTC